MVIYRRAEAREYNRSGDRAVWRTVPSPSGADRGANVFGALTIIEEETLAAGAGVLERVYDDNETVVYVCAGGLAYTKAGSGSGVILAGGFLRVAAGERQSEANASHADSARVFRLGFDSRGTGLTTGDPRERFSAAQRRGRLCLVASPDGRVGSLRLGHDVLVYSVLLDPGQHVAYELSGGRNAWIHIVQGEASLGGVALRTGDGAGVSAERGVSLTASGESEVLLVAMVERPGALRDGGRLDDS